MWGHNQRSSDAHPHKNVGATSQRKTDRESFVGKSKKKLESWRSPGVQIYIYIYIIVVAVVASEVGSDKCYAGKLGIAVDAGIVLGRKVSARHTG